MKSLQGSNFKVVKEANSLTAKLWRVLTLHIEP
jgi:hypothetical protein